MDNRDLLTVEETAAYLRVTKGTIWRWCRSGKLPATKIGHQWRIRRDELEDMIHPQTVPRTLAVLERKPAIR